MSNITPSVSYSYPLSGRGQQCALSPANSIWQSTVGWRETLLATSAQNSQVDGPSPPTRRLCHLTPNTRTKEHKAIDGTPCYHETRNPWYRDTDVLDVTGCVCDSHKHISDTHTHTHTLYIHSGNTRCVAYKWPTFSTSINASLICCLPNRPCMEFLHAIVTSI